MGCIINMGIIDGLGGVSQETSVLKFIDVAGFGFLCYKTRPAVLEIASAVNCLRMRRCVRWLWYRMRAIKFR
mgnify:CR=1 FL=1